MKKKTIWKSPNSSLKFMKEKELLKILNDGDKTKEFLKRLNQIESSTNKIKNNTEDFINVSKNNLDKITKNFKFDSPYIWFSFLIKCLPNSLNNEDFIKKFEIFLIGYLMENNNDLYEIFVEEMEKLKKETTNGEVQDK